MTPNGETSIQRDEDKFGWFPPEPRLDVADWDPLRSPILMQVAGVLPDPPLFLETLEGFPSGVVPRAYAGKIPDATQVLPVIRPEVEHVDPSLPRRDPGWSLRPRAVGVARPPAAPNAGGGVLGGVPVGHEGRGTLDPAVQASGNDGRRSVAAGAGELPVGNPQSFTQVDVCQGVDETGNRPVG